MKVCPKCQSTYTDETLSFCLTDGTPLLQKDVNPDALSAEFSNADTIFDRDSTVSNAFSHTTDPQTYSQQTQFLSAPQIPYARGNSSKTAIYSVLGTVLVLALLGGGIWWAFKDNFRQMYDPPREVIKSAEAKKTSSPLTPDQENQIKKEVADFLIAWKTAIEKRDINEQMRYYAKTLETFYRDSDKDQNHVRAERLKAIERYESLNLDVSNISVTPVSERFATAIFDKSWVFRGKERYSSGSVQQEMGLVKSDGKWYIVIEKDLQTYNVNNRQNPSGNTNPNAANTNANSNQ
jgi:hypothetical protein